MPPVAASVVVYACPVTAVGSVVVVMPSTAATVSDRFALAVCALASVTLTVSAVAAAAAVGVPVMAPALVSCSPAGSAPAASDQLYGAVPPLAASVAL